MYTYISNDAAKAPEISPQKLIPRPSGDGSRAPAAILHEERWLALREAFDRCPEGFLQLQVVRCRQERRLVKVLKMHRTTGLIQLLCGAGWRG